MGTLFGTDGIRGIAYKSPLTKAEVYRLGFYAGELLKKKVGALPIRVIGVRDTRISGEDLFDSLTLGLTQSGVHVFDAGVLSTPSIAYLVKAHRFHSGFVISASHNPAEFNGIKFFTDHGRKWPDEWEREIEEYFAKRKSVKFLSSEKTEIIPANNFLNDYADFLTKTLPRQTQFKGLKVALDCSHGANSSLAPHVFQQLGADVFVIGNHPNGKNINERCGSQHTAALVSLVRSKKCHVGFAFDGDGDRVIAVDEKGNVIDGDFIIAILAKELKAQKRLSNNCVILTVMANLGLKKYLKQIGIHVVETAVGDRHVSEAMRLHGSVLGGEQSGHIILGEHLPSGDGLLTALQITQILNQRKVKLSTLTNVMRKFPQVLKNVSVPEKKPLHLFKNVHSLIQHVEKELGSNGRLLVRYSGTEPLLRVMLEGPNENHLHQYAENIISEVKLAFQS